MTSATDSEVQMRPQTVRLHRGDNVVTATTTIATGTAIEDGNVTTRTEIPVGHKAATAAIAAGDPVRKYNQIIGFAT